MLSHGNCDFVKSVKMDLVQTTGLPLQVTVPVRAMRDEAGANVAAKSTDAPHGYMSATIDQGRGITLFERDVSDGVKNFIGKYPGQTAEKLTAWTFQMPKNPDVTYIQAKPESAILHFLNHAPDLAELRGADFKPITADNADAQGMATAPTALIKKATEMAIEAIEGKIAYSNVTDPAKFSINFTTLPETVLQVENGKAMAMQKNVSLAHGHLSSTEYLKARMLSSPQDVKRTQLATSTEPLIQLRGKVTIEYKKVHPNFEYKPSE
jgi:hypothetical protein